ncbi:hypothetical protein [Beijerinckia mobilis]|uniref:hypothetical protein n=1 Tax=Beijerinckia mobilis TaxID=231434 RepID=UPI0012EC9BB5|nr:hypothetical protein [Beijerinckia mobilis]
MSISALVQLVETGSSETLVLVLQILLVPLAVALMYFALVRPLRKRALKDAELVSAAAAIVQSKEAEAAAAEKTQSQAQASPSGAARSGSRKSESGDDIGSLMAAVRDQAVELRCEQAKVASTLSLDFDVLTNRLSTIEPLLTKVMEEANKNQATVALLTATNDDFRHKISELEGEIGLYRPLALKLEDDLRVTRSQLAETDRKFVALETDYAKAQSSYNELLQKMTSTELARQRAAEENVALGQKLNEHEFTIQSLLRETAHLKSDTVAITSDLDRAEREAKSLSDKYAVELESSSRANAALTSLQIQFQQFRKENAAQIEQAEEREKILTESLSIKEKQFYDSEIKRSALESKIDFLTRTNQRLREDLRRHLDHIGNLEASNRKLLELLARNSADEKELAQRESAKVTPILRAVPDSQNN